MLRSESGKLPALERPGKGEGLMLCPVPTPSVLINQRQTKVTNFWRSPYNEVFRIAKAATPSKSTLPDVTSPPHRAKASPTASPTPPPPLSLPQGAGHQSPAPSPRVSEDTENKGDNSTKIRGILSRPGGENSSDGGKKRAGRRVQFADRYEKLCELGKKYGSRTPKAETAAPPSSPNRLEDGPPRTREGSDPLRGEVARETTDVQDEEADNSEDIQLPSRSSSLPDLVSAPLSGSTMSPFKLSPLSNEPDTVKQRPAKADNPVRNTRLDSPLKAIRNPYSRHSFSPSRLIRTKTSMTSQRPYVIYGYDVTGGGDGGKCSREKSSFSTSLRRSKTFLAEKDRDKAAAGGGSLYRRPLASLCDASKTQQIIQWLRDVDVKQAKEGKCTASLAPASSWEQTS